MNKDKAKLKSVYFGNSKKYPNPFALGVNRSKMMENGLNEVCKRELAKRTLWDGVLELPAKFDNLK